MVLKFGPKTVKVNGSRFYTSGFPGTVRQSTSEFVPGGRLKGWSVWDKLPSITVPTLAVGARHDTMRPADMERISKTVQHGQYLFCPNGSHLAMWDDQEVFMKGVIDFIHAVDGGSFSR